MEEFTAFLVEVVNGYRPLGIDLYVRVEYPPGEGECSYAGLCLMVAKNRIFEAAFFNLGAPLVRLIRMTPNMRGLLVVVLASLIGFAFRRGMY